MSIEEMELFEAECKLLCYKGNMSRSNLGSFYNNEQTNWMYQMWLSSKNREGYKLVPVEMSWQKADELASKEWDKNKSMFCVDNRDMSALQVEEFRLRWCKNKAYQIMSDYKAMIGACE